MSIIHVSLPDEIQSIIDRQIASGRVESADAYLVEAARRFAADIEAEDEIVSEASAGIADADAGFSVTIATPVAAEAWHNQMMARVRARITADEP